MFKITNYNIIRQLNNYIISSMYKNKSSYKYLDAWLNKFL